MGIFSRKVAPPPRIQTIGEMIAYSLTNEATRTLWAGAEDADITSPKLRAKVSRYFWRDGLLVNGARVPLTSSDESAIRRARAEWVEWDNECRRAAALVTFVDAFEQTASAGEAGTATDSEAGVAEGERATAESRDAQ